MEEKDHVKTVNRRQLHDLGIFPEEEQFREAEFARGKDFGIEPWIEGSSVNNFIITL